jgi:hypothetical protein
LKKGGVKGEEGGLLRGQKGEMMKPNKQTVDETTDRVEKVNAKQCANPKHKILLSF